ncbi:MAG: gliding motility protein GldB [Prevotella sp.]|nr:gliding motility protein GldB [Prevotella sp.]
MRKVYSILLLSLMLCVACQMKLRSSDEDPQSPLMEIVRYDRLEYRYLTTGDFSALQEMNTEYPIETRTLIEDVLKLGTATDPEINTKLLKFYQDTTLQALIADAETEYANMEDLNRDLNSAFTRLKRWFPDLEIPQVYSQISALDQSIVVGNEVIGISLDKYLGEDYPLYRQFYSKQQRKQMTRNMIVPDALTFYLISVFPISDFDNRPQEERDLHVGKLQWIVNQALERRAFRSPIVIKIDNFMRRNPQSYDQLLLTVDSI